MDGIISILQNVRFSYKELNPSFDSFKCFISEISRKVSKFSHLPKLSILMQTEFFQLLSKFSHYI